MVDSEIQQENEEPAPHSASRMLRDWILVVLMALGAAMLVRVYVLQQFYISGPSWK